MFSIQSNIHGYQGPATQRALHQNFEDLHKHLEAIAAKASSYSDRPIPPEVLNYVDEGRNPDIYTREFVELTQKGNRYLRSKATAFGQFRDTLAQQMVQEWPEMKEVVDRVLEGTGAGLEGLTGLQGGGNRTRMQSSTGESAPSTEQDTLATQPSMTQPSTQTDMSMQNTGP